MNRLVFPRPSPASIAAAVGALSARFGNRVVTSTAVCAHHAHTTTWIAPQLPDAVVFPASGDDVVAIVQICALHGVPIIPFGTGTSFEGGVNAPLGGISIDFRDMNRLLAIHPEDFDCVIEPGLTRKALNEQLRDQGLFFPVDPGADASLGGMASTRASGTNTVRYGTMKDNVLALKVVLANGEVIATARRARKSAAGYDLTQVFVGAEGTLGIITELTLRLHGIPEAVSAGHCSFPSVEAACNAAIATIQSGIPVARVELLDEVQVRGCNRYSKLTMPEIPMLFVEFHGSEAAVAEQTERFGDIIADHGGSRFSWAMAPEDRTRLWQARHDVFWAAQSLRPGARPIVTDACVPISRLAECVVDTKADIDRSGLIAPIVAHAGDGNFHAVVLVMLDDPDEVTRARALIDRIAERAIAMDGTCTGEHGIGQGKAKFLETEHGIHAVHCMRNIKQALDPHGLMNPAKLF